ncbi:hypothetical protein WL16_29775 [Burkholderia ubonensis]|nr:hypothetical protein WL16_29775 [Burkholderia ubonensis]
MSQIHNRLFDVGLRELSLLLLTWLRLVSVGPGRVASMRPRGRFPYPTVVALRLDRLCNLQHVAQAFVFDDRALIDLGQSVVLPVGQHTAIGP